MKACSFLNVMEIAESYNIFMSTSFVVKLGAVAMNG